MRSTMTSVTDLEVYQRFTAMVEELEALFARGPTLVGGAAISTACHTLRGMASAIYEHSLSNDETEQNAPH
jgi:hypothetical protein